MEKTKDSTLSKVDKLFCNVSLLHFNPQCYVILKVVNSEIFNKYDFTHAYQIT